MNICQIVVRQMTETQTSLPAGGRCSSPSGLMVEAECRGTLTPPETVEEVKPKQTLSMWTSART